MKKVSINNFNQKYEIVRNKILKCASLRWKIPHNLPGNIVKDVNKKRDSLKA